MPHKFMLTVILALAVFSAVLAVSCADDSDEDGADADDDTEDGDKPPAFTEVLEAIAVGDVVYRYVEGNWEVVDAIPSGALPWYSVDFRNADDGWAGARGVLYRYDGTEWTLSQPGLTNQAIIERVRMTSGGVWALANEETGHGSILRLNAEGAWDVTRLDDVFGGGEHRAKDFVVGSAEAATVLVTTDRSARLIRFGGEEPETTALYDFDPLNWLTFNALVARSDGRLIVGGRLNNGVARQGVIWAEDEEGAFAPMAIAPADCVLEDVVRFRRIDERLYMLGMCTRSVMYVLEGETWTKIDLPDNKGVLWRVNDLDFVDEQTGWAVGYSDSRNLPLLLLRDPGGWQQAEPPADDAGAVLYGVAVWPADGDHTGDDDLADDDTGDDDTGDDDTGDDDDDDTGDDDDDDDDTGDDDTSDDDTDDDDTDE
ncbi:MAG: hypothetical protein M5R36_00735 [Deltaproteobacteria bacterium]|nr:hypothetical protein [Deltaproteobacteria bacterium]